MIKILGAKNPKKGTYNGTKERIQPKNSEITERFKERSSEIVVCECGCSLTRYSLSRHRKTNVHLNFMIQRQT